MAEHKENDQSQLHRFKNTKNEKTQNIRKKQKDINNVS